MNEETFSLCERCGNGILQRNVKLCSECRKEVSKMMYDKEHNLSNQ